MHLQVPLAPGGSRSGEIAVVAETELRERESLSAALREAGYAVSIASGAEELEELLWGRVAKAHSPLVVVGVSLARRGAGALTALSAQRARVGLPEISVILSYDAGTLTTVVRPSLGPCNLIAIFEKPFDLDELRSLARTTRGAARAILRRFDGG